jgi:glycerophosphoryl diester phosphodiesterase/HEAT repeat protein
MHRKSSFHGAELPLSRVRSCAPGRVAVFYLLLFAAVAALAQSPRRVDLYCHRTANEDVPENTLESLDQAVLLGCDWVELDIRRTLDGVLVLNHDGLLERLTDGIGDAEQTYYADLQLRDFGAWMSPRFAGLPIATFRDALRLARERHVRLILDIKKPGLVPAILDEVREENMLDRVRWPSDWDEVRRLVPDANAGVAEAWVQPGVTAEEIAKLHAENKHVIVNFSANGHEMDLRSMKAAVAAGADGINVDFPRLGADAVGRPVEQRIAALIAQAGAGPTTTRSEAILTLARYRGFPLTPHFAEWLLDPEARVSRAAAIALVTTRPAPDLALLSPALHASAPAPRANAAWALGQMRAPASTLLPLLGDRDSGVLAETLLALSRIPGPVDAAPLIDLLQHGDVAVRGPAALALAAHHPDLASAAIAAQLRIEVKLARDAYSHWEAQGEPKNLPQSEIDFYNGFYRCEMKMIEALSTLYNPEATRMLEAEAFRPDLDFSQTNGDVAAFQLWDRIATDPGPAIAVLAADPVAANRAEWMLIHAGAAVLPAVAEALPAAAPPVRERLVEVLALQGDPSVLPVLEKLHDANPADADVAWAIDKVEALSSAAPTGTAVAASRQSRE